MQRHKVTRIKRKSKCDAAATEMEQGHDFPRPGRDLGQEQIPRPRTEFSRTSALEGRLKPERSWRLILQIFGWSGVGV